MRSVDVCRHMELMNYVEALEVENNILASGMEAKQKAFVESFD